MRLHATPAAIASFAAVASFAAGGALGLPAAASAASTTRYEAESLAPTSQATWVSKAEPATTSAGKFRWLNSNGMLEVPVRTAVASIAVRLKGASCGNPAEPAGSGPAGYQIRGLPGYSAAPVIDPDPARLGPQFRLYGAPQNWTTWTFRLGSQSLFAVGPLVASNRVQLRFLNDFKSSACDRNLAVDYIEITG